ncbi:hypothetical protein DAPPUDRAFT_54548 [Daphnia pulex]|uniref:Fatty acyl-CoA reductase n=1 Tax=Daphnia pulex TaxID=6669 RepID=E9GTL1_DAPPU|nr:hypothetical protein DAPPUDRAFT_54548 [Daphnia pulex]|eukprot:EFX77194.1 hypothetical protein DAPPUDRAFT_54548 [Daphnia pulex]
MKNPSNIAEFYQDKSIFITGSTGFMGKVLVEKLLRSCPGIDRVYLLLRPSKGKDIACRLEELINNEVFQSLQQDQPDVFKKLVPVSGDISLTALGLSTADQEILNSSVSIVFHTAARINFDDNLRQAIDANIKGPQKVITFCSQLKKLQAFVHVSTVFNNLDKGEIDEVVYPASMDPQKLMEFVDCMDNELLASITKQLVGKCPNVYAFTKAIENKIPLAIVRPSIVTCSLQEPIPGWIDNLNGPSGFVVGVGKGLLRTAITNCQLVGDMIPVDISINLMIAAAWKSAIGGMHEAKVYNCVTGSHNPVTWGQFNQYGIAAWKRFPTKDMAWYPSINYHTHEIPFKIEKALFHYFPAYFFDFVARIIGKKPIMVSLYNKIHRASSCLNFYVVREWKFVSNNPIQLLEEMSVEDRRVFNFDVREINWESYVTNYILGCRRFLLKDNIQTLQIARRNLNRYY